MNTKVFVSGFISLSILAFSSPALAQSYQASLVVVDTRQTAVGSVFEESVTIKNSGSTDIPAGSLKITLPQQLRPEATDPKHSSRSGQTLTWAIPAIAPGNFFRITYEVTAMSSGSAANTQATYEVNGAALAQASYSKEIKSSGAGNLPRTGTNPWFLAVIILSISLLVLKNFQLKKK